MKKYTVHYTIILFCFLVTGIFDTVVSLMRVSGNQKKREHTIAIGCNWSSLLTALGRDNSGHLFVSLRCHTAGQVRNRSILSRTITRVFMPK